MSELDPMNPQPQNDDQTAAPVDDRERRRAEREGQRAEREAQKEARAAEREAEKASRPGGRTSRRRGDAKNSNETPTGNDDKATSRDGGRRGRRTQVQESDAGKEAKSRGRIGRRSPEGGTLLEVGQTKGAAWTANRREIPTSTYDLMNGSFAAAAKARLVSIVLIGVVTLFFGFTLFQGISASVQNSAMEDQINQLRQDRIALLNQFGASTGLVGVSQSDVIAREQTLSESLATAIARQPDVATLVDQITRYNGLGVTVTSVAVARSDATKSEKEAPTTSTTNGTPAKPSANDLVVTVIGASKSFDAVVKWSESVRNIPELYDVTFTRQGLKVTLTAKMRNNLPAPAAQLLASFGISVQTTSLATGTETAPSGADTTTSDANSTTTTVTTPGGNP